MDGCRTVIRLGDHIELRAADMERHRLKDNRNRQAHIEALSAQLPWNSHSPTTTFGRTPTNEASSTLLVAGRSQPDQLQAFALARQMSGPRPAAKSGRP